jgi:Dyp-type peroxidase family
MSDALELDDIQGLLARGYAGLSAAHYVLLEITNSALARTWLAALAQQVTSAAARPAGHAVNVAVTAGGLSKLGLQAAALAQFSDEFAFGMTSPFRRRILGDVDANDPDHWSWGGPTTPQVDVLLLLYADGTATLASRYGDLAAGFAAGGLVEVARLETALLADREHFGFRDGISQPTIEGLARSDTPGNTIKAGEFVLGYPNEYGLYTDRPMVPASADPRLLLPSAPDGRGDLGRNGSYLVLRQLEQDVRGFWRFLDSVTRGTAGTSSPQERTWLAAKIVGRWPNGAPLAVSPDHDDPDLANFNDFGYGAADPHGLNCPIGAHVRRAHPRDSLDPEPRTDRSLALDKRHRLLRRGRKYGPALAPEDSVTAVGAALAEEPARGLYFICLCANIARQFEFVQHTWLNNPKFDGLYEAVDPLNGQRDANGTTFVVPRRPVRRRISGMPAFVRVRGGGYFFLPGGRAIRYLASLAG